MLSALLRRAVPAALAVVALVSAGPALAAPSPIVREFTAPTASSQNSSLIVGPDGNLWWAQFMENKIVRYTPGGAAVEFAVPTLNAMPNSIAAGPDGNLWFTEWGADKIGRITPSGTITEFALPTTSAGAAWIVAGPDGNLWFTEYTADKIGRITPAGVVTEFALPAATEPYGITVGPDGNLWFSEFAASQIGRITPAGTVTEFALPTPAAKPGVIVAGPDGNLWVTETGAHQVAKITPSGVVTEFPVPSASQPWAIASGPDGNLWITHEDGNTVDRVTPAGVVTEFSVPGGATGAIASGPGNAIWFTEHDAGKLGRLFPQATPALSATSAAFGALRTSTAATRTITLENTGATDVALSTPTVTGAAAFTLAGASTCTGTTVLAPGESCELTVRFAPTTLGAQTATVTVPDDASGSPRTVALTGTGTPPPPRAATGAATGVGVDAATLAGLAGPNGAATDAWFEYGTTTAYGATTPARALGDGTADVAVAETLSHLTAGTTYHFRLVTVNASGTVRGADGTFTTAATPPPPAPPTAPAPTVAVTRAAVSGHTVRTAFTATDASVTHCRLDSGPWVACASPYVLKNVQPGSHDVTVRASGPGGTALDTERFTIARDEPQVTLLSPKTLSLAASGTVKLSVRCDAPRGTCAGTAALRRGTTALARASFRIRAGKTATLRLKLSTSTARRLASAAKVSVVLADGDTTATLSRVLRKA
ncbi:choice-of-anchor D domain-containing protein [Solirubrobacter phytolaccae]|uniref:Choice-of-anchor D domain-containing protein n=1 Tax=Solirubrobacter phytolaccae TaxID=1404360 RepID=A0A9X3S5C5_9ACTN|nr:choice-of-anchor D domain-containing protein [Solirubrobacter phytolaccae]MDA0178759.1 choice-of-anchor D domain-containing protein [Solirubrobacter phytolaccae]